ncbi:MAG: carboxypeptidase-like regulatory domain-containing protein [Bacteroidales bacterium]|nr:carboxypeptidase-like regulatory domain-containing protein [Bacteroidales bacterium]
MINKAIYQKILIIQLFVLTVIIFHPISTFSQSDTTNILNKKISLNIKKGNLYDALIKISKKTGYNFSYNSDLISNEKKIKINVTNKPIEEILHILLSDTTFCFKTIANQIVICDKNKGNDTLVNKEKLSYLEVKGKIIDSKFNYSLAFATIYIEKTNIGTISNVDGEFIFKIPNNLTSKNLIVSFIGYRNLKIPINQLTKYNNLLTLEANVIPIQEVIIRSSSPQALINSAISSIPDNYCTQPAYLTSFYRETIKRDNKYAAILEAVVNIYKTSYNSFSFDRLKIIKSRKNMNYLLMDTLLVKIKGGLQSSLMLDIVKIKPSFLTSDYFHFYYYNIIDIVDYDNQFAYVIEFKPKKYTSDELLYSGKIYLDMNSLSIKEIEFWLEPEILKKQGHLFIVSHSRKLSVKPQKAIYRVNYRKVNNKNYLNYVSADIEFKVRKRGKLFSDKYNTLIELAVNKIDTTDVKRFKYKDIAKINKNFFDVVNKYLDSYWEDYNYIKPDESLQKGIEKLYRDK